MSGLRSGAIDKGEALPERPVRCEVRDCDRPADVCLARVRDEQGVLVGAATQFLGPNGCLLPGLEWAGWIARCSRCFDRERRVAGTSQLDPVRALTHEQRSWVRVQLAGIQELPPEQRMAELMRAWRSRRAAGRTQSAQEETS